MLRKVTPDWRCAGVLNDREKGSVQICCAAAGARAFTTNAKGCPPRAPAHSKSAEKNGQNPHKWMLQMSHNRRVYEISSNVA